MACELLWHGAAGRGLLPRTRVEMALALLSLVTMSRAWQPILDGELAARATRVVRELSDALAGYDEPTQDLALLWSYLIRVFDDELTATRYEDAVTRLASRIEQGIDRPQLFGGAAGFGWVVAHATADADDLLELIDRRLVAMLSTGTWRSHYDLIGGLVGFGVYFLERGDAETARVGLERVIALLAASAVRSADGVAWHTPVHLLPDHQLARFPSGFYNLGMAHGTPGVVAFLSRALAAGVAPPPVRELRDEAVRWLNSQRLPPGTGSYFPKFANQPPARSRAAWCYGDPGVLLALWRATPSVELEAQLLESLARPLDHSGVVDANLCHGSMGLAHISNRMYQATRDPRFRELARAWIVQTLAYQTEWQGIAGYGLFSAKFDDIEARWTAERRLLDGACGIALGLIAATTDIVPEWDRLMLCDIAEP